MIEPLLAFNMIVAGLALIVAVLAYGKASSARRDMPRIIKGE